MGARPERLCALVSPPHLQIVFALHDPTAPSAANGSSVCGAREPAEPGPTDASEPELSPAAWGVRGGARRGRLLTRTRPRVLGLANILREAATGAAFRRNVTNVANVCAYHTELSHECYVRAFRESFSRLLVASNKQNLAEMKFNAKISRKMVQVSRGCESTSSIL
eukprot:6272439-Pyramimonas_sp.AAC.1